MKNIIVYGDVFVDEYIHGSAKNRSNPESSSPLVNDVQSSFVPGGAANVALNLASLGCNVNLITPWGIEGEARALLEKNNIRIWNIGGWPENRKTRVIADDKYLCRVDWEPSEKKLLGAQWVLSLLANLDCITKKHGEIHGVIISDYTKGAVSIPDKDRISPMAEKLLEYCQDKSIPAVIDSKKPWWLFRNDFTAVMPNEVEWRDVKIPPEELSLQNPHIYYIITRGAGGISLYRGKENLNLPAFTSKVVDVVGAGDSVTAGFMARYLDDVSDKELLRFVNAAGAAAVNHRGTHAVSLSEILTIYERNLLWHEERKQTQRKQTSSQ